MTNEQHLRRAAAQIQLAASALVAAHHHLAAAGYETESRYLTDLATSMFDTGHDLTHHTQPED